TAETQRHIGKPSHKFRGGELRFSSSSSGSANATAPDRFCGPRFLGDGTPANGPSTLGSSSDSEGSRGLNRLPTKRRTNHSTTIPTANCHQMPTDCVPPWRLREDRFQDNFDFRKTRILQTPWDQTA